MRYDVRAQAARLEFGDARVDDACVLAVDARDAAADLERFQRAVDRAVAAMRAEGVEPVISPIRGGTDGARLSYMGMPCPNLCTGGENFHSRFEYIPVESLCKVADILCRLITDAASLRR